MKKLLFLVALTTFNFGVHAQVDLLTNGSFESGALGPWAIDAVGTTDAGPTSCAENWIVATSSVNVCTIVPDVFPTDGSFAAFTSFDTNAVDTEWILEQTVSIPATIVAADFSFDFVAEFDFSLGAPITIPRELRIDIYRTDGTPFSNFWTDTFTGSGIVSENYSESIDVSGLLSGLEGMDAVIRITASIAEVATGPGKAMIDNVSFVVDDGLNVADFTLANALQVSPNPSNGAFTINYEGLEALQTASIYDITGKQLAVFNLQGQTGPRDLTVNLPSGLYLLKVDSDLGSATKKLVIQ